MLKVSPHEISNRETQKVKEEGARMRYLGFIVVQTAPNDLVE